MTRNLLVFITFVGLAINWPYFAEARSTLGQPGDYRQAIVFTAEGTLSSPEFMELDPNLDFLRDIIEFSETEIDDFGIRAETFFYDRFGFDFSAISADSNNVKLIPDVAMLMPFRFVPEIDYRAIYMSGRGVNRTVETGGFAVVVVGNDVDYKGDFGGSDGKPAFLGEVLAFGFYRFGLETRGKENVISFAQTFPTRITPDGFLTITCDIFHPIWGHGLAEGLGGITPIEDGQAQVFIRNVLAFPGRLSNRLVEKEIE